MPDTIIHKTVPVAKVSLRGTWHNMIRRCYDPSKHGYKNYGGRGIRVCDEWRFDYISFSDYVNRAIGMKPGPEYSLDRTDNNGDYCPGNLQWATRKQQAFNRTVAIHIWHQGTLCALSDICDKFGLEYSVVFNRRRRGWDQRLWFLPAGSRPKFRQIRTRTWDFRW